MFPLISNAAYTNFYTKNLKTAKRLCFPALIVRMCQFNELALLYQRSGISR